MDTDLEQAGAFVTATLAAVELDNVSAGAIQDAPAAHACLNCGQRLTNRYCAACGQAAHLHRSLLHLVEEFAHSVLHFDAKGWRTLPLLAARPGLLTRRHIDGQRMRYVSPLALFLFTSFLMFFAVSLLAAHGPDVVIDGSKNQAAHEELTASAAQARQAVERARAALEQAQRSGGDTQAASDSLSSALLEQRLADAALKLTDSAIASTEAAADARAAATQSPHAEPSQRGLEQLSGLKFETGIPWVDDTIKRVLHNPELFLYRLENTAYKYLFMLIPISLPFLWLMFIGRRNVAMYDHAVFSLYSLSFMSLLILVCALLMRSGLEALGVLALIAVPPIHMFLQLRGTFMLSVFGALWRTAALIAVAGTAFGLFLLLILLLSLR